MEIQHVKNLVAFLFIIFLIAFFVSVLIQNNNPNLDNNKEKITLTKKTVTENLEITAKSALVHFVSKDGTYKKDLFEKNGKVPHLIASVTKLMTALIAEENIDKNKIITITNEVATDKGSSTLFNNGEKWNYETLLHLMLIPSNNDAAEALATSFGYKDFIYKMNTKALEIGLKDTHFINPSGLEEGVGNTSTVHDLAKLIIYIEDKYPQILEVTQKDSYLATDVTNIKTINATSTDILLSFSAFPLRIVGGKTGETPRAKKNLILITEAPNRKGFLVFVVLKSEENFTDTVKLAHWVNNSFEFK